MLYRLRQFFGLSGSLFFIVAEKQHFGPFWPLKRGFRVLGAYYFYIIARKRHPSIIIDKRNLSIWFSLDRGSFLTGNAEKQHFGPFWPLKRGFRVLGAYYFYIIARKRHPSIIIDIRKLFTYGFH